VTAYISGHEHAMQYHEESGVHYFVSGASFEYSFYKGIDPSRNLNWIDKSGATGFFSASVYHDRIVFRFVGVAFDPSSYSIVKEVVVTR